MSEAESKPTVFEALSAVMEDVRAVRKAERNTQQNYLFRGIDAVVNAVGPAFRKHGVIVTPEVMSHEMSRFETGKGAQMFRAVVLVKYTFYGPAADSVSCTAMGEGSDSLDKAMSKAMSVAYRTALLQTLTLPTDEPDPDSFNPPAMVEGKPTTRTKLVQAKAKLWSIAQGKSWDKDALSADYFEVTGDVIGDATVSDLEAYAETLAGRES